jgi:hypothetical protein
MDELRRKQGVVWTALLKRGPSNADLRGIITSICPEEYKEKAWEQLQKQGPSKEDIRWIINNGSEKYKAEALGQFLQQEPGDDNLIWLTEISKEYRAQILEIIKLRIKLSDKSKERLIGMIIYGDAYNI